MVLVSFTARHCISSKIGLKIHCCYSETSTHLLCPLNMDMWCALLCEGAVHKWRQFWGNGWTISSWGLFRSSRWERSHGAFSFVLRFFTILTLLLEWCAWWAGFYLLYCPQISLFFHSKTVISTMCTYVIYRQPLSDLHLLSPLYNVFVRNMLVTYFEWSWSKVYSWRHQENMYVQSVVRNICLLHIFNDHWSNVYFWL